MLHTFVDVSLPVSKHPVDKTGQLVCDGCDGLGCPEASDKATEICTQCGLAPEQGESGHAQGMCGAIDHVATGAFDNFAAGNAVVGAQAEPGSKILLGLPACHVQAHLGD